MKFVNLRNVKCNTKSPNVRESEKFLLVESGILGFGSGIQLKGFPLPIEFRNPKIHEA